MGYDTNADASQIAAADAKDVGLPTPALEKQQHQEQQQNQFNHHQQQQQQVEEQQHSEKLGYVSSLVEQDDATPTDEDLATLRRIPERIPLICFTVAFVELCERFAYYGTTAVCELS